MWEWQWATGRWQCEVKERASCWWSPCENGSVTENRLLPCHAIPEQSTERGRGGSWWPRPKSSVSGSASCLILYMTSMISFTYSLTNRFLMDRWIAVTNRYLHSLPPARRDYCVLPSINAPTAVWVFVFACIWTANADEQEPRPQNTKLPHNVADNYHDNIHGLKGEMRQNGWRRNAAMLQKSIKQGRFSHGIWAISVVNTCLTRNNCNN